MNSHSGLEHLREVQRRIEAARSEVEQIIQRQKERMKRNRRFLDDLRG